MQPDPFADLGLPALADLTDDDVRAAWRRIAAATHPDREDGGDPVRFGAAAAAYAVLRTPYGRGEALADLGGGAAAGRAQHRGAHRLRAAAPSARYRPAADGGHRRAGDARGQSAAGGRRRAGRSRRAGDNGHRRARDNGNQRAGDNGHRHARDGRSRHAGDGGFVQAVYAWFPLAGDGRYRHPGYVGVDRGLALPAGGAALAAAAAVAAAGWTPATIGLVAGALTVTAGGLLRRAGRDR